MVATDHRSSAWFVSPDALIVVDRAGTIVDANDEASRLFRTDDLIGTSVDHYVPDDQSAAHPNRRDSFHDAPRRRSMGAVNRLSLKRADGTVVPVHIALSPMPDSRVLAVIRDINDIVVVEERLTEALRRRILVEDHERIARDLHDRIIQQLFALGMNLQAALPTANENNDQRVSEAVDTLDDIIRAIRDVIFDVRRAQPDDDSLRSRIIGVSAGFISSLGFEPSIELRGSLEALPTRLEDHLLAVVREGLANVARHANASSATVELLAGDDTVSVRVTDNGRGLPETLDRNSGHANLLARARLAGGSFRVKSRTDGGTLLEWHAPRKAPDWDAID